jgi:RimJ/RimL family protein N-acetyltransferase
MQALDVTGRRVETARGPVIFRPERPDDEALLFRLFCSWALEELQHLPLDEAMKQNMLRFQFAGQTETYRDLYPDASFDIIEREGVPIGRFIVDPGDAATPACFVDFVLLPELRNDGLGRAITAAILAEQSSLGRKVQVKVLQHNRASRRMCAALGFVEIGEDPPFVRLEWSAPRTPA